ncbi:MAG TPA: GNAT family N-acetyltransferase [Noviherbaspirillum sp.]
MKMQNTPGHRNPPTRFVCRLAQAADLDAIHAIQEEAYPPMMQEPLDVIHRRLAVAHDTCWIALDDAGPCGYLFAYPSTRGAITSLGGDFVISTDADTLYLHDLAVSRRMAGQGVSVALCRLAMEAAVMRKLRYLALVAVKGARGYWARLGFEPGEPGAQCVDVLQAYPEGALYMSRRI